MKELKKASSFEQDRQKNMTIDRNIAPTKQEVEFFLKQIDFKLPDGFIEFFKDSNGADISSDENYIVLWALTDMIQLNKDYNVDEYAPDFFIFGSDGGDTAYTINKSTSDIYEMPFIGMANEEAIFKNKTFSGFIEELILKKLRGVRAKEDANTGLFSLYYPVYLLFLVNLPKED